MRFRSFMEALRGEQHKIDKNKNGKIDAHDFKLLRKEQVELDEVSSDLLARYKKKASDAAGEADKKGDFKTGNKRFSGIIKATNKQFANAMKKEQFDLDENECKEEVAQTDESYDFNRAALAKQRLQNLRHAGRKVRGATLANLMRAAGLREEEMDEQDLDQLDEVLGKDAAASDWIHDFVHSTNPKFEGKSKKERIKMALGAYYGKQNEKNLRVEETDTSEKNEMAETQLHFIKYAAEEILEYIKMGGEIEEWYQNKLSKVQSEIESLHSYVEGESRRTGLKEQAPVAPVPDKKYIKGTPEHKAYMATKKPRVGHPTNVKEEYDEEGNITYSKLSYKDFASQLLEYITGPGGVTRVQGRGYGTAKGSKYGSSDYDSEHLDKNDDEHETSQPQKRGRGRPAGSKSGARGPRIK